MVNMNMRKVSDTWNSSVCDLKSYYGPPNLFFKHEMVKMTIYNANEKTASDFDYDCAILMSCSV